MRAQIVLDGVIVDERVVDVEQEDEIVHGDHAPVVGLGSRHGP